MTPKEAADLVEHFLAGSEAYPGEWGDFADGKQLDSRVEYFRKRCDKLSPLVNRPGEMDAAAVVELRSIIQELRTLD